MDMPVMESRFSLVCRNCDSVAVQIDGDEQAPPCTPVRCARCQVPRGTLGDLRALSTFGCEGLEP
jgi:hypothetical protein